MHAILLALANLPPDHPAHSLIEEANRYATMLNDNIKLARPPYREDRNHESNRADIVANLNRIALEALSLPFSDLCQPDRPTPHHTGELPSPYRGLFAFRPSDANFFFGRDEETKQLLDAILHRPFTPVFGYSGSGKSSLLFAGLIPALPPGWIVAHFRPGEHPIAQLADALIPYLEPGMSETDQLIESKRLSDAFHNETLELHKIISKIMEKQTGKNRLLLVMDQGEELYTLCQDEPLRMRFIELLAACKKPDTPLRFLLFMRADFLNHALSSHLMTEVEENIILLRPMAPENLKLTITKPAELLGVQFADGLVSRMLEDVGQEPGNLPLLEFALEMLWKTGELSHAQYEVIGGVTGALAKHAEQEYQKLHQEAEQVRQVMVQLVKPGEGTEDTRKVATIADLQTDWGIVKWLADARLVVTGRDSAGRETVEVVHEALIRRWGKFQEWMQADRKFRTWQEGLQFALDKWEKTGDDEGGLLRGAALLEAEEWLDNEKYGPVVSEQQRLYIEASVGLREREREAKERQQREREEYQQREIENQKKLIEIEQKQTRLLRRAQKWISFVAVVAIVVATLAGWQWWRAEQEATIAFSRQLAAESVNKNQQDPRLALLMAMQSDAITSTAQSKRAIVEGLQASPYLRTALYGHTNEVKSVAYSKDGTIFASAGHDRTIVLWDMTSDPPTKIDTLKHNLGSVHSIAFSPDKNILASGSCHAGGTPETCSKGEIILWDMTDVTNVTSKTLTGHDGWVRSVAFSPDGKTLASGSDDSSIILWDMNKEHPTEKQSFKYNKGIVFSIAFNPVTPTIIASGIGSGVNVSGTIVLWNSETGKKIDTLQGHGQLVATVAFSPDGTRLVSGSMNEIIVWDVTSTPITKVFTVTEGATKIVFNQEGTIVASSDYGAITLWDMTGKHPIQRATLRGHPFYTHGLAFSPDGKTLVSGSGDKSVIVWDVSDVTDELPTIGNRLQVNDNVSSVAFSPDKDNLILAAGSWDKTITLWDASQEPVTQTRILTGYEGIVKSVAFNPVTPTMLASAGDDKTIVLWDIMSNPPTIITTLSGHSHEVQSIAFSPDGKSLASGSCRLTLDERTCAKGEIIVWDVTDVTDVTHTTLTGHDGWVRSVAFNPVTPTMLASGSWDNKVILWDIETQKQIDTLECEGAVYSVAFSPNGKTLASGDGNKKITLWDIETHRKDTIFTLEEEVAVSLAFSPDGKTLASGSSASTKNARVVTLWDLENDPPMVYATLAGHKELVYSLAFSPDGNMLASGSEDETIILWDLDFKRQACDMVNRNLSYDEWQQYIGSTRPYDKTCPTPPIGEGVLEHGDELARQGNVNEAIAWYEHLNDIDDTLDIDPQARAQQFANERR